MFKTSVTYQDYDGNERTKDLYFNLSKAELFNMQFGVKGGLDAVLNRIAEEQDMPRIIEYFRTIIRKAYGKKSLDGDRFMKSDEIWEEFEQSEAYSEFFVKLISDDQFQHDFMLGIMPADVREEVEQKMDESGAVANAVTAEVTVS